jgi:hypothetical protein
LGDHEFAYDLRNVGLSQLANEAKEESVVVILVHWLIKKGIENEQAFKALWRKMTIQPNTGLYREVLTRPVEAEDPKFNTFSITDNAYTTYINIGIWE